MMIREQLIQRQQVLTMAHNDYEKGLSLHAFFKLSDRAMSQDLVQETFMKTWVYLVKGGKIETMKAFLYHVLGNLIIDEYRKRKNKVTSLEVLLEAGFEPRANDSESLLDILDGRAALCLIERLPEKYRQVMRMRYMQGLSLGEMSLVSGCSKSTIAVQAYRGLEKLKLLYHAACD